MLSLEHVLSMRTDEEFRKVFQGTAIVRTKREGLLRNAAVVSANTHSANLFDLLLERAEKDPSIVIRRHALWAAATIASKEGNALTVRVRSLVGRVSQEGEAALREEIEGISSQLPNLV